MGYQVCARCVLDTNIPGIRFNGDGVCNFCEAYAKSEAKAVPKDYAALEREFRALAKADEKKYKYDCLCLYSGGKDSTNMLYNLVNKHKLRVLAFTLDNWFLSQQTYTNISKVIAKLGVDHVLFKPSKELTSSLFKSGIFAAQSTPKAREMSFLIGHACWPCFVMISIFSIRTALEKNIPTIVVGATPGQLTQKESSLIRKYHGISDVYEHMVLPFLKILPQEQRKQLDMPLSQKIRCLSLRLVPFYEYHRYSEEEAYRTAESEFGWQKPADTDSCSSNFDATGCRPDT
jgi:tRNA(Ile)-lysidine synthase TilS/MesJ